MAGEPLTFPAGPVPVAPPWNVPGPGSSGIIRPPNVGPAGGASIARTLFLPLPEDSPIPDAKEFNVLGTIATAIVQANVAITNATFAVPAATMGRVSYVSLFIMNMLAVTDVTFTVQVDSAVPSGFGGLRIFPRAASSVVSTFDCKIRVQGPCTISVIFSNNDGGAYTVGAAFGGWFWPQSSDERWKTAGM